MVYEVVALGAVLGFIHAFEPDHLAAVATMSSKSKNILWSSLRGVLWGFGHSITLLAVGVAVFLLSFDVRQLTAVNLEMVVGAMLIGLGIFRFVRQKHSHEHSHTGYSHSHEHKHGSSHFHSHLPVFVGMVHGLAGSGALVIAVLATIIQPTVAIFYLIVFSVINMISMGLSSMGIGLVFNQRFLSKHLPKIYAGISMVSIFIGSYIILEGALGAV